MEKELEFLLEEDTGDNEYEFCVYGGGFGKSFEHQLYDDYMDKIDKHLTIFERNYSYEEVQDILKTLEESIVNGKDFYSNAKPYMKKEMEEYNELLDNGYKF
ncbi:MAG: hypothetical protein ACRC6B_07125 [Fusobacteriaceae bacterium]